MRIRPGWLCQLVLLAAMPSATALASPAISPGERIYRLAGCENCHTDREHHGEPLAGGRQLSTPLGTFYTPNITPDRDTGIGHWSEGDFRRALRQGVSPSGNHYYPSFPYTSYSLLSDSDIHLLWEYLRHAKPVHLANKPHELPWYLRFRRALAFWKWLYFEPGPYQDATKQSVEWNRGAYLVGGAGHCGECHTPRNVLGGFRKGRYLAGEAKGVEGFLVPNITPDRQYGIGNWSQSDIVQYLATGLRPDGDSAGCLMAEVIDHGLKHLPEGDLRAIAIYIKAQPAVANPVAKGKRNKAKSDADY